MLTRAPARRMLTCAPARRMRTAPLRSLRLAALRRTARHLAGARRGAVRPLQGRPPPRLPLLRP
eukprot:2042094-Prymnesium_polylepis.1